MLNKIMLIGNLGKDPDFNVTPDGTPVAKFSMAVSRNAKNRNGERVKETEWFNIVAWRQLAEICEKYLHKGSKVYIEGRLTQRKYTDKEGIQRTAVEVIANDMQMRQSLKLGVERQDALIATLKKSAYLRALTDKVTIAFVPYGNLENAKTGTDLYACKVAMVMCRKVGNVAVPEALIWL